MIKDESKKNLRSKAFNLSGEDDVEYSSEYLSHLSALNKQVTQFIKNHIDDNALVILTPVFKVIFIFNTSLSIICKFANQLTI